MLLFWFLLGAVSGIQAACLNGYTEDNGNCFSSIMFPQSHNEAYIRCARDNAYIQDVYNGFINTQLQSQGGSYESVWLGLSCTGNSFQSCYWDSGRNITSMAYSNFAPGNPSASVGACVLMRVATGKWYSVDCALTIAAYICETTPGVTVPSCASGSYYFNGYCYFGLASVSLNSAESSCQRLCGHVTSIHSEGENSFVRDYAASETSFNFAYIGLQNSGSRYTWTDYSSVDYKKFGYENAALGYCTSMANVAGEVVNNGEWISSPCTSNTYLSFVCKKSVDNGCDATPTPPPTMAPPICSGTQFVSGYGQLYSPGYPYGSQPNKCEYLITENDGSQASITIQQASLDQYSSISLYNSFMDKTPFVRLTNGKYTSRTYYSNSDNLKVVYNTTGSESFNNLWYADYGSAAGSTPYTDSTTSATETTGSPTSTSFMSSSTVESTTDMYPACGGTYTGSGTVILYGDWQWCTYTFRNAAGVQDAICIRFNSLEDGPYIFEGDYADQNKLIAEYIPTNDPSLTYCTSNGNSMTIYTYVGSSIEVTYDAAWNMVPTMSPDTPAPPSTDCFYELYGSGEFISPNYPGHYPTNTYCEYRFHSSRSRIVLRFTDMNVFCEVKIYEGYPDSKTLLLDISGGGSNIPKNGENFTSQTEMVTLTLSPSKTVSRGISGVFSSSW